uniref:Uncharacterized protein n=1 Tax=Oryza brachyantha TaxID=4533 RepID=J3KY88_ORYBR
MAVAARLSGGPVTAKAARQQPLHHMFPQGKFDYENPYGIRSRSNLVLVYEIVKIITRRRKPPSVCLERGSPGATCCKGHCVDTRSSIAHCGRCHHVCKHGKTCCGGRCVDLRKDRKNCGDCFVHCPKKCSFGMCDYAG